MQVVKIVTKRGRNGVPLCPGEKCRRFMKNVPGTFFVGAAGIIPHEKWVCNCGIELLMRKRGPW